MSEKGEESSSHIHLALSPHVAPTMKAGSTSPAILFTRKLRPRCPVLSGSDLRSNQHCVTVKMLWSWTGTPNCTQIPRLLRNHTNINRVFYICIGQSLFVLFGFLITLDWRECRQVHWRHLVRAFLSRMQWAIKPQVSCIADLCQLLLLWEAPRNPLWVSEQNSCCNAKLFPVPCSRSIIDAISTLESRKVQDFYTPISNQPATNSYLHDLQSIKIEKVKLIACPDTSHHST